MTMRPPLRVLLAALCLLVAAWTMAAEPVPNERARIETERAAVEATWAARKRECATRFAVTACVEDAQRIRRAALADLRRQEVVLDESLRRERAAARLESLDEKARRRPAPSTSVREPRVSKPPTPREPRTAREAPDSRSPAASAAGNRRTPALPRPAEPRAAASAARVDRHAQDAERAAEFEARAEAMRTHRETVERRNAERASKGKQSQPLPVPAGASAP